MWNFCSNSLINYASKSLKQVSDKHQNELQLPVKEAQFSCNFLKGITDPLIGLAKIEEICQEFPNGRNARTWSLLLLFVKTCLFSEWTILQLCKGPRTDTSYSIFPKIHENDAAIYMIIMKHARSYEYKKPLCLRFSQPEQRDLYKQFAVIVNRFKENVKIAGNTVECKKMYWKSLDELNKFIAVSFYFWYLLLSTSKNTVTKFSERLRKSH